MNQNFPPNEQESSPYGPQGDDQQGTGAYGADDGSLDTNPYAANQNRAPVSPDLDAGAPVLKSNDIQKLNRKALVFLGGIILLIICAVVWMINAATSRKSDSNPRAETVVVPDAPPVAPPMSASDSMPPPIAVAPPALVDRPQPGPSSESVNRSTGPSLMERRMAAAGGTVGGEGGTGGGGGSQGENVMDAYMRAVLGQAGMGGEQQAGGTGRLQLEDVSAAEFITNPDALMVRGTYIRCVLETRIVTDIPGFTSCVVTEPVYSINGRTLLLPKGSKISGQYQTGNINGPRVSVIWDRITTPNGINVKMSSPGVDNLGGAGHVGDYNAHWVSKIASAMMVSIVADAFKYAAAEHGPRSSEVSTSGNIVNAPYESSTAHTMEEMSREVMRRNLSRPATVTITQGTVVNVYVAKDVDFTAVMLARGWRPPTQQRR
ncbi:MAG: secretion protein [Xanthomonadaceae bacterium]|jgi:type IV secretion system protein VirB10|nr:secretion protein [Xanthomonadaceae bacterium]